MVPMYRFLNRSCANFLTEVMIFEFYPTIVERGMYFWRNEAALNILSGEISFLEGRLSLNFVNIIQSCSGHRRDTCCNHCRDRCYGLNDHRYVSISEMDTGTYCRWWDSRISAGDYCCTPCKIVSLYGRNRKSYSFNLGIGRINYYSSACDPCPNSLPRSHRISLYFCHPQSGSFGIWEKSSVNYVARQGLRKP